MPIEQFSGPGYTKQRGAKSQPNEMIVEAEFVLGDWTNPPAPTDDPAKSGIFIRLGVAPHPGDRPLDRLAENAIKLSFDDARLFAAAILKQVAEGETHINDI